PWTTTANPHMFRDRGHDSAMAPPSGLQPAEQRSSAGERIVDTVLEAVPGIRFCFNTSPETTLEALRRAVASR
ncbi:hypothetical protein ACW9HQ_48035, partial [Nocardia gipuzkoensis]